MAGIDFVPMFLVVVLSSFFLMTIIGCHLGMRARLAPFMVIAHHRAQREARERYVELRGPVRMRFRVDAFDQMPPLPLCDAAAAA